MNDEALLALFKVEGKALFHYLCNFTLHVFVKTTSRSTHHHQTKELNWRLHHTFFLSPNLNHAP